MLHHWCAAVLLVAMAACSMDVTHTDLTQSTEPHATGTLLLAKEGAKARAQKACKSIFCNESVHQHPWLVAEASMCQPSHVAPTLFNTSAAIHTQAFATCTQPFAIQGQSTGITSGVMPNYSRLSRDACLDETALKQSKKRCMSSSSSDSSSDSSLLSDESRKCKAEAETRAFGSVLEPQMRKTLGEESRKRLRTCSRAVEEEYKINKMLGRLHKMISHVQAVRLADGMAPFVPEIDPRTLMDPAGEEMHDSSSSD